MQSYKTLIEILFLTFFSETIEFVETLEDVEIKERNTIEMQVEVSAEESKVKWYKDGEILSEADNHYEFKSAGRKHSIVIKNATVHHEGEYVASVGEQECSCELTVIGNWFRPGANPTKRFFFANEEFLRYLLIS